MRKIYSIFFICFLLIVWISKPAQTKADEISNLRNQIDEKSKEIEVLEKEIEFYEANVNKTSKEVSGLRNTLKALNLSRDKLVKEIKVAQSKIYYTNLSINKLDKDIDTKKEKIETVQGAIANILTAMNIYENNSGIETIFVYPTLSEYLDHISESQKISDSFKTYSQELKELKKDLEDKKNESLGQKKRLQNLKVELDGKKKAVESEEKRKADLLKVTKNKESEYRKVLANKLALKNEFEKELYDIESQLKIKIDPGSLPKSGTKALSWPLDNVKVTQHFGITDFARNHGGLYTSIGHNGIDLKASVGTAVKAAASGKVVANGDTDAVCPGASYGKWVYIEHKNGLSTLYGHLSVISARSGQIVESGDLIGLSGNTGYSTGPHLHFTVYATQGVKLMERKSKICKGNYYMPFADLKAYLNPLLYL